VPNILRSLRRRILTPNVSATRLDVRGFHRKNPDAQQLLETIGRVFLDGYGEAAEAATGQDVEDRLEQLPAQWRGFAYEGAAMGFAVRDGLPIGGRRHVDEFLAGPTARDHRYIAQCGVGWALARLPRFRWPDSEQADPLLRWLVLDGYGFHQAYFHTDRYVHKHFREPNFPWPRGGPSWYADRAIDQGIGRALWFVGGTDVDVVATLLEKYPAERHGDLYAGVGLAATFAGGVTAAELRALADRAGAHRPQLAQGSAFAAEARVRAGIVVPHTAVATEVFCGATPELAAAVTQELLPDPVVDGEVPAYEHWRAAVARRFAETRRAAR
jgi:hypothetical protein